MLVHALRDASPAAERPLGVRPERRHAVAPALALHGLDALIAQLLVGPEGAHPAGLDPELAQATTNRRAIDPGRRRQLGERRAARDQIPDRLLIHGCEH
jgi:hypothetical protein